MTSQEEKIITTIAENLNKPKEEVKYDRSLWDLGCDGAADRVELNMALEDEFNVEIDDDAWEHVETVEEVVKVTMEAISKK